MLKKFDKPQLVEAFCKAADWLEQHPDNHITHDLAMDENSNVVPVTSPKAECFCAFGRFMRELGVSDADVDHIQEVSNQLADNSLEDLGFVPIFQINDSEDDGKVRVIKYIKEKASC